MEFSNFLKVLWRYKLTLLLFPLITVATTFYLIRNLPRSYRSTARVATGLVERSDEFISKDLQAESKISQEFSNLIQMMLLKKNVDQVSYLLLMHDLTDGNDLYRKQSKLVMELTKEQKDSAILVLSNKYKNMEELSLWDKEQNLINRLLVSEKFDYESLVKKLNVYRLQTSDYIYLDFESENPMLSAVVLNSLCKEFINYYTLATTSKSQKAVTYLDSLSKVKQASVAAKMNELRDFKIKNGILDVNNQASVLMGQIADFQAKKQEAQKNIAAYTSILVNINGKLGPEGVKTVEKNITQFNQEIANTRHWLNVVNELSIKSNFDPKYQVSIDSLQGVLSSLISEAKDKSNYNNSTEKQDLVKEKMNNEINLDMAKNSVASLDTMVNVLTRKLDELTPSQANIQVYEKDIENQGKEYEDLLNKLNQTKLESSFPTKLRQVEMAMPEIALPSKKILLLLLAAVGSFLLVVSVLFIIHYFDHTINNSQELINNTGQKVLASFNLIKSKTLKSGDLWASDTGNETTKTFKSQLRTLRFEIDNNLAANKIIVLTSLQPGEGKTFLSVNLARAYKMINKKVLLIDGNFENPDISHTFEPNILLEDYFSGKEGYPEMHILNDDLIVMGNKGNDISLLETNNQAVIQAKFQELKEMFDVVVIDIPSLDTFNKAREWISFSDKVVTVFSAGKSFSKNNGKELDYLESIDGKSIGWVINKVVGDKQKRSKVKSRKTVYA